MGKYDRLTALDASFLHLERLEYPMHVGALSIFEGGAFFDEHGQFRIAEVRTLVESRLALMPRFRRRLMNVPYDQGRPIWVDDDRAFDASKTVAIEDTNGYDFVVNTFRGPGERRDVRALNVNTVKSRP